MDHDSSADKRCIYSAHQSSFMPWIGFWQKVAYADVFDVSNYDQFTIRTWQHYSFVGERVKWGLQLADRFKHQSFQWSIHEIKVVPGFAERLLDEFRQAHQEDRYFMTIFPLLEVWLQSVDRMEYLWQINYNLLCFVRDFLSISTPIVMSPPAAEPAVTATIIHDAKRYDASQYLSGPHGKNYLDQAVFQQHGIELLYQDTERLYHTHPRSIVSEIAVHGVKPVLDLVYNCKIKIGQREP